MTEPEDHVWVDVVPDWLDVINAPRRPWTIPEHQWQAIGDPDGAEGVSALMSATVQINRQIICIYLIEVARTLTTSAWRYVQPVPQWLHSVAPTTLSASLAGIHRVGRRRYRMVLVAQ